MRVVYSIRFHDGSFVARSNGARLAFASDAAAAYRLRQMRERFGSAPLSAESRMWDRALVVKVLNGKVLA